MSNNLYREAEKQILVSRKILIISHRKPDADTLGSAITMKSWLSKIGKDVTMACVDDPSKEFPFLPHVSEFVSEFDLNDYDLLIFVDVAASYMTDFHIKYKNIFEKCIPTLNIDHHATNEMFGSINIVDPKAASTTVILYKIFKELGVKIDDLMATCMLAGIYGDTGSFKHANTSEEVYKIASELMTYGAKISDVSKAMFNTKKIKTLRLWGEVLEKAYINDKNIIVSVVNKNDYRRADAGPENLSGIVEYLNMVPETKYAILVNEDKLGNIKGSLRTRNDDVDLAKIASRYGGGGHSKASGFCVSGKIKRKVAYKIVSEDLSKNSLEF